MSSRGRYQTYAYRAATIGAAYLVSLTAWLDTRGVINLTRRLDGRPVEAWVGTACLVVTIPGWFIVTMVRGDGLATKLTDTFIPILSGIFWGLLVILLAKLTSRVFRHSRATVAKPTQPQS